MTRTWEAFEWNEDTERTSGDVLAWLKGEAEWTRETVAGESARCPGCSAHGEPIEREEAFAEAINYRRKDVRCLTKTEEDDLVAAMTELAKNGTWGGFVDRHGRQGSGIHGTLGPGSGTHPDPTHVHRANNPNAKENAMNRFLPWHRLFLLEFEDELRAVRPKVTLPYWCWSEQRTLPGLLSRMPTTIKGTASGDLTIAPRTTGGGSIVLPTTTHTKDAMDKTTFRDFTEALEEVHNTVHAWVGGTMNDVPRSPADPIFWLMHCEVDRIWTRWTNSPIGEKSRLAKTNRPVIVGGSKELPGIDLARRLNEIPPLIVTTRAINLGYGYDRLEDAVKSTCTRP